jgi:hypothetical protein
MNPSTDDGPPELQTWIAETAEQTRLVIEHAGMALYHAQIFEEGLGWFLQACAFAEGNISTEHQRQILDATLRAKTLGSLLKLVRTKLVFSPESEAAIDQALADRNILVHDFFKQYGVEWVRGEKREEMIERLKTYQDRFRRAGRVIQAHAKSVYREIGVTREVMAEIEAEVFKAPWPR